MSEKALPCPFCGSDARAVKSNGASCSNLRCVGSGCVGSIAAWNTRAPARSEEGDASAPTPTRERCTCGHTRAIHDGADNDGECVHEDDGHLFCMCSKFALRTPPVAPSEFVALRSAALSIEADLCGNADSRVRGSFTMIETVRVNALLAALDTARKALDAGGA